MTDGDYLEIALSLAARGRGRTSPNPLVGAVVVTPDGVVVGAGHHAKAGGPHAEIHALNMAGARAAGATLYCTLEPCCHYGRTGPCVERIVAAGVARVVASLEDPNPEVSGRGFEFLRGRGLAVDVGTKAQDAARLNAPFLTAMRLGRPHVILKVALSADGRIGLGDRPVRITGERARRHAHLVRAEVDAIAVGSGTVLIDDPLLTARASYRERPLVRVVFDRRLRMPPAARLLSTIDAGPVIIMTTDRAVASAPGRARALESAGASLHQSPVADPDDVQLRAAFARLHQQAVRSVLVEGGAGLHAALWSAGLADQILAYVSPVVLGPTGRPWLVDEPFALAGLADRRVEPIGEDVLIDGHVHRTH